MLSNIFTAHIAIRPHTNLEEKGRLFKKDREQFFDEMRSSRRGKKLGGGIPGYSFPKTYHNCSRSQRFQKMISRDALRCQQNIFQNILRFQDSSKFIQHYPKSVQDFANIFQIYRN